MVRRTFGDREDRTGGEEGEKEENPFTVKVNDHYHDFMIVLRRAIVHHN